MRTWSLLRQLKYLCVQVEIADLSKNNANLHHEMRANHLDITTK